MAIKSTHIVFKKEWILFLLLVQTGRRYAPWALANDR